MLYFANPSTAPVKAAMRAGLLGFIDTPAQRNRYLPGVPWCADNGCYGSGYPGDTRWYAWLGRRAINADTCRFAVAPDVVGDAAATMARSLPWLPRIRALGYPAALVAQDGLEDMTVPWDQFDALFLGGTTGWKLGPASARLAAEAVDRGKWLHCGRVNSAKRLRYAQAVGCHSADGTILAMFPDRRLPDVLAWLRYADHDPLPYPTPERTP